MDAGNIDGSIHRWAKNEVIDNDREDWKRISASMRKQPDALRYDRQTIFGLVVNVRSTFTKTCGTEQIHY
ncbi:hypothetical protein ECBCE030MS09_1257 [Escherichia coli BCE030_MS-09]|nr:hypothetical protein ECBCE030MS09_1257 [Escherichia coli BCE030_MS-09]